MGLVVCPSCNGIQCLRCLETTKSEWRCSRCKTPLKDDISFYLARKADVLELTITKVLLSSDSIRDDSAEVFLKARADYTLSHVGEIRKDLAFHVKAVRKEGRWFLTGLIGDGKEAFTRILDEPSVTEEKKDSQVLKYSRMRLSWKTMVKFAAIGTCIWSMIYYSLFGDLWDAIFQAFVATAFTTMFWWYERTILGLALLFGFFGLLFGVVSKDYWYTWCNSVSIILLLEGHLEFKRRRNWT